jgi:hypothetical protein
VLFCLIRNQCSSSSAVHSAAGLPTDCKEVLFGSDWHVFFNVGEQTAKGVKFVSFLTLPDPKGNDKTE